MTGKSTHQAFVANGAPWPRCAASAAIFRAGKVLLVERGSGALKGRWSLPGGHIEPGERAAGAAAREVF
jgi:8-oxo-dGTP diphosphatase